MLLMLGSAVPRNWVRTAAVYSLALRPSTDLTAFSTTAVCAASSLSDCSMVCQAEASSRQICTVDLTMPTMEAAVPTPPVTGVVAIRLMLAITPASVPTIDTTILIR